MLGMPATTQFDLNFRLLGIPVRINPLFWVLAALLGWEGRDGTQVVIWIACVLVSILVHEFGHGLTARAITGTRPSIVLYAMGGLCFYEREHRSPWGRLAVILMGPGAGFLLFGLVAALGTVVLGIEPLGVLGFTTLRLFHQPPRWMNAWMLEAYSDLLLINLYWGIFNLLPIFPLDGGQATQTLLAMQNRREGVRRGFIVSLVTAGLLAIYLYQHDQTYNALFVAYLGLINFQYLQAAQYQGKYGNNFEEDEQWWRR